MQMLDNLTGAGLVRGRRLRAAGETVGILRGGRLTYRAAEWSL
jgi:hypothetical protein